MPALRASRLGQAGQIVPASNTCSSLASDATAQGAANDGDDRPDPEDCTRQPDDRAELEEYGVPE